MINSQNSLQLSNNHWNKLLHNKAPLSFQKYFMQDAKQMTSHLSNGDPFVGLSHIKAHKRK